MCEQQRVVKKMRNRKGKMEKKKLIPKIRGTASLVMNMQNLSNEEFKIMRAENTRKKKFKSN